MLNVIIKCPVQSGEEAKFIALGHDLATRAKTEPGCISYQIAQDLRDPKAIFLVEAWESNEHLGAHMAKPYFKDISDQMVALQSGGPEINVCQVVG